MLSKNAVRRGAVLAVLLPWVASPIALVASEQVEVSIRPRRVATVPASATGQVVAASDKGDAFVVTSDFELFPLTPDAGRGSPRKLATDEVASQPFRAALSSDGRKWLIGTSGGGIVMFDGDRGVPLPTPPVPPVSLGFAGSDPILTIRLPPRERRALGAEWQSNEIPIAWRWGGSDWEPLLRERISVTAKNVPVGEILATTARLFNDRKGGFWLAFDYRYELRRFSAATKKKIAVSVRGLALDPDSTEMDPELAQQLEKIRATGASIEHAIAIPGTAYFRAAGSWQGDLFTVVGDGSFDSSFHLDRIDGLTGDVGRAKLEMAGGGRVWSMAAASDGLYFGTFNPADGIFFSSWEEVAAATWTPVKAESVASDGQRAEK